MKIALIGASGKVGSALLDEAIRRGHQVTGIVRNPDKLTARAGLTIAQADANDATALTPIMRGHDVVICSGRFNTVDIDKLIPAVKMAGVARLLMVGGAGSLKIAPNMDLVDSPDFPEAGRANSRAGRAVLECLRAEPSLDWTFLSPSRDFPDGERTGVFRLGKNDLLVGPDGKSWISKPDYAIAMLDEVENPQHSRQRFTVGY